MAEISINEYVRTKDGYIGRYIKEIIENKTVILKDNETSFATGKHNIAKHSKNIIDLIEERRLCEWCKNNIY